MYCKSPFMKQGMKLPCGHCAACKVQRTREWAIRLAHEASTSDGSSFITLTYNDLNVPLDWNISKRELQLYFKRLRKGLGNRKLRYYAVGEYGDAENVNSDLTRAAASSASGPARGRPHYHILLFGLDALEHEFLGSQSMCCIGGPAYEAWNDKGFVYVGNVNYKSARYVAGYIHKKMYGKAALDVDYEQPFSLVSRGIGKDYCLSREKQLRENLFVTMNGVKHSLPRYYVKLLGLEADMQEKAEESNEEKQAYYEEKYAGTCRPSKEKIAMSTVMQLAIAEGVNRNIEAKNELFGGKI